MGALRARARQDGGAGKQDGERDEEDRARRARGRRGGGEQLVGMAQRERDQRAGGEAQRHGEQRAAVDRAAAGQHALGALLRGVQDEQRGRRGQPARDRRGRSDGGAARGQAGQGAAEGEGGEQRERHGRDRVQVGVPRPVGGGR